MLRRLIQWSVTNRALVILLTLVLAVGGGWALRHTPLEALPDLSDVQVVVQTDFNEQAPRIVEDQVTFPVAAELLKVPGARTVRGYSFFGVSFVYVIFDDGTDLYWARARVQETLNGLRTKLPSTVAPTLGPDATGLGWVYQYALEDTTGRMDLAQLRAVQDWYLRYALTAVSGVAEVASVGGFEKQYQLDVDPARLQAYGLSINAVMTAVQNANADVGAMVLELSEREYMVRGLGYLKSLSDIEQVVVGADNDGTPVRVADLGRVSVGPAVRRGIADLDGRGDAVGGIVVMRFGENALATIERVKAKLAEVQKGLPPGVVVHVTYDRSDLIQRAIGTLRRTLIEESVIVALVCLAFLLHARSALVAILTLPVGILGAFAAMRLLGTGADIMSLGGIAIAIGAMIDAAIVMIENLHKHFERAIPDTGGGARYDTGVLSVRERWGLVVASAQEVGPALFFSLLVVTVSFLPVFALTGQEGRLFKPLALTKTLAMASASMLSVTLVPVAMGLFVRGKLWRERANPVNRWLIAIYRPVLEWALRSRGVVLSGAIALLVLTWIPWARLGSEFMPPLDEGSILYMPTTLPGVSVARARELLRIQDSILKTFPEVERVWGKAGRANTSTDPAGMEMFETTITLRPASAWRAGMTHDRLIAMMDSAVQVPGMRNAWTMPIRGRIDMLATGIRTPVGIKVFGPDLATLEQLARQIEMVVQGVPGTRSAYAERAEAGYYLDIAIDRAAAARHGLNVGDVQTVIAAAIGGMVVTQTVEGRERFGVRVRYPQELRDTPERLARVLVPTSHGLGAGSTGRAAGGGMSPQMPAAGRSASGYVPLGQVATITRTAGPMVVRTEGAQPTAWVYVDVVGVDLGRYVRDARQAVERDVKLPTGYSLQWSGQFEFMESARARLQLVVPATLVLICLLLYLNFGRMGETAIVLLSLPFALVGGLWFTWGLGYNWSVAVAIGFIALAGVAAETGVVMLLYLNQAWDAQLRAPGARTAGELYAAVMEGAVERVRPKMMTVTAIIAGLLPLLWSDGAGSSVMRRIAAPMIGGMVSSTVLTLLLIPIAFTLLKERELRRGGAS